MPHLSDEAIEAYQGVIDDYGQDPAPALREIIARALEALQETDTRDRAPIAVVGVRIRIVYRCSGWEPSSSRVKKSSSSALAGSSCISSAPPNRNTS